MGNKNIISKIEKKENIIINCCHCTKIFDTDKIYKTNEIYILIQCPYCKMTNTIKLEYIENKEYVVIF